MSPNNHRPKLVLIEQHNIGRSIFYTTPLFWDCECNEGYIHPCTEDSCVACNSFFEDSPDARVDEVFHERYGSSLPKSLVDALEEIALAICPDLIPIPF